VRAAEKQTFSSKINGSERCQGWQPPSTGHQDFRAVFAAMKMPRRFVIFVIFVSDEKQLSAV
jgi:hypothetical protein